MLRPYSAKFAAVLLTTTLLMACGAPAAPAPTAAPVEPTTAPAPTAALEPTAAEPTAAAAPESPAGELVIYTSRAETLFNPVIAAFNAVYPDVKVTLLTGGNNDLAAKILEERANPIADVFINSDTLSMEALAAEDVFLPNDSPAVQAVPLSYRAEDGNWVSLTLRARVIMYNTDLVTPEELPTSIFDLTDPKWKGQIGAANSTNGAMMANLVAIRNLFGEEKANEFISGLIANETQFFGGHTDVRKAVGAGEIKLGFVNHYYYHLSKAEGAPVGIIYPDQGEGQLGLVVNSTNAGIIKGSKHEALARLFVDFMLSPEGQKIFAKGNFEYPIVPGVELAEGVEPLANFKLSNVTLKTMWDELEPTKQLAQMAGLP
jgi:iron(III) transport system substrate-binding protein